MSLRIYTTPVVVLHRINLGEQDKIVTLYTLERGKLNAVAKGARKSLSKLSGATELFTHARLQLAVGRTLDVVTQAEIVESFQHIRADLERIAYASVMAELVDRFVEERDPHPEVFGLIVTALRGLEAGAPPDLATLGFELHLLSHLGYHPHVENCVVCGERLEADRVAFSPSLGGTACAVHRRGRPDCLPVRPETLSLAGALLRLAPGDAGALGVLAEHVEVALRRELGTVLRAHSQYRLERPLKSLDFVREVQAVYRTA